MHSLVRWPNKGCTVVLTESITRERNYVRVKRPEEDESHRALRVIAQSGKLPLYKNMPNYVKFSSLCYGLVN